MSQKRGRFERADKGTIFLDEIGELPLQAQTRLLRVLQNKEIERIGGADTISLNIRVIAATNRNLEEMVKNGEFREDLWFRLNVFPIQVPPLRARTVDIPALIQHFINLKAKELKLASIPAIAPGAIEPMMSYRWPGNVRELQNVIERALILNPQGPLTFENLGTKTGKPADLTEVSTIESYNLDHTIAQHISRAVSAIDPALGNFQNSAYMLGDRLVKII